MLVKRAKEEDIPGVCTLLSRLGHFEPGPGLESAVRRLLEDSTQEILLAVPAENALAALLWLHHHRSPRTNLSIVSVREMMIDPAYREPGIEERLLALSRIYDPRPAEGESEFPRTSAGSAQGRSGPRTAPAPAQVPHTEVDHAT